MVYLSLSYLKHYFVVIGTVNNFYAPDIEIEGLLFFLFYPSLKIMTNDGSRFLGWFWMRITRKRSSLHLGQYMSFGCLSQSG